MRRFGALSNERFGRGALVRSLLLAATAVVVLLSSVLAFALATGEAARAIEVAQEGEVA